MTSRIQSSRHHSFVSSPWPDQRPQNQAADHFYTSGISSTSSSVPLTRGATSPWTILLGGTASADVPSFYDSTSQSSVEETSLLLSTGEVHYDLFQQSPNTDREQAYAYIRKYATIAPYPILEWGGLVGILNALIDQKKVSRFGQVACIWIYMAFGCTQYSAGIGSDTEVGESGVYFQKAWRLLPQLLMDNDSWALKAVTLMVSLTECSKSLTVHYLQASAKPEACWSLLGTALRISISLGFHSKDSNMAAYSDLEREEGKRAFWLCYIMEKSLCINLGRPSSFNDKPTVAFPEIFPSENAIAEADLNEIYGANEIDAVAYFIDMIELTYDRNIVFQNLHDESQNMSPLLSLMHQRLTGKADLHSQLRNSIRNLAYHNTILVVSARPQKDSINPKNSDIALHAARTTLDIITEASHEGELMCVWMWLYYAFTAATVIFLHSIANPLHPDTALNLASISDLETICQGLAPVSEGAKRVMDVARRMREVVLRLVKSRGRKRQVEDEESVEWRGKVRRVDEPEVEGEVLTGDGAELQMQGETGAGAGSEDLFEGLPGSYAWDEWDRWIVDVVLESGDGEAPE